MDALINIGKNNSGLFFNDRSINDCMDKDIRPKLTFAIILEGGTVGHILVTDRQESKT